MEAVQKAVNEAVHAVRNSPLLKRRFGDRPQVNDGQSDLLSPEKDRTPFVQGFSYRVEYLGRSEIKEGQEQDHGCCDRSVDHLWNEMGRNVSVRVTTNSMRIKAQDDNNILFEFPVLRMSYCGIDKTRNNAISFVAKDLDGIFYCFVFRATSQDKAYAMALSITKAFYLACQILQEQQGEFPPTPNRETLFEPQREDDTKSSPARPHIPGSPQLYRIETQENHHSIEPSNVSKASRPSVTSVDSLSSNIDDDFVRLAKARSNPDILRSTVELDAITHPSLEVVKQHADPASRGTTPYGSQENLIDINS